jgi:hypothetical protein
MQARLAIYLNDHLAGATIGVQLARRAARENEGTELGEFLRGLGAELDEDRTQLIELMRHQKIARSRAKHAAGWTLEKLGRLKLNGQLAGYSPLSRLLELEGLAAGTEVNRGLWSALAELSREEESLRQLDYDALAERARCQRERLEPHRLTAAAQALRGGG